MSVKFVCMTQYDATMPRRRGCVQAAVRSRTPSVNTSADKGLTQLRIAETEKYAHVTFFFNGGVEAEYKNEDRVLVQSPAVATYEPAARNVLQPEVTEKVRQVHQ